MSTIPLTLIEGAMALPRTHPLERLPRSFGREWALLPPNISFRAELKALYAAMLHTFCLSADAFRSACRWEPLKLKNASPATVASVAAASGAPAAPARAAHVDLRMPPLARRASSRKRIVADGVCAVSGAAVLAWIALSSSHSPPVIPGTGADEVAKAEVPAAPQIRSAQDTTRHDDARLAATTRAPDRRQSATATTASAPPARDATQRPTRRHSVEVARANVKSSRKATRDATGTTYAKSLKAEQRRTTQVTSANRRVPASNAIATGDQHIVTTRRPDAALSATGRFSPDPASTVATDDYASIKTWAATLTGSATTPRAPTRTDNTAGDWMSGMKQRRVTEVPDSFSP
ncbi:hypothetical protein [Paraburkholderia saeva]|uniref:hypothetical protein n=1 Tax=Paraburkholderia saeva TaxID=2777537 RepID=UPI001DB7D083|nr:hypothetical protein [Paraburkholderia saeva]CAG4921067.1 hypothetical protein R52603_04923 [Paraburkholderia saeva]